MFHRYRIHSIFRSLAGNAIAAGLFFCIGCSKPEPGQKVQEELIRKTQALADSATPIPAVTPESVANPVPVPAEAFPLTAQGIMDHKSFATIAWQGQPSWAHIGVLNDILTLAAHGPQSAQQTTLRVLLPAGAFHLTSKATLRPTSEAPVVLTGSFVGQSDSLFSQTFKPGELTNMDQNITVPEGGKEFQLQLKLAPGTPDTLGDNGAYGAALFMAQFKIEKVS